MRYPSVSLSHYLTQLGDDSFSKTSSVSVSENSVLASSPHPIFLWITPDLDYLSQGREVKVEGAREELTK